MLLLSAPPSPLSFWSGSACRYFRSVVCIHLHYCREGNCLPFLLSELCIHWLYLRTETCVWLSRSFSRYDGEFAPRELRSHSLVPPGSFMVRVFVKWRITWKAPTKRKSRYVFMQCNIKYFFLSARRKMLTRLILDAFLLKKTVQILLLLV